MIGYVKGILEEADDQCIIVDNHESAIESSYPVPFFLARFQLVRK